MPHLSFFFKAEQRHPDPPKAERDLPASRAALSFLRQNSVIPTKEGSAGKPRRSLFF
jgi:hypothetical protein